MNVYKQFGRRHGPGGPWCPCCNAWGCHPRSSKRLERRLVRRKMKQSVEKEVQRDLTSSE